MYSNSLDCLIYPSALEVGEVALFEVTHNLNLPFIILSTVILIISILTG